MFDCGVYKLGTYSTLGLKNAFIGARKYTATSLALNARMVAAEAPVDAFSCRFFLGMDCCPPSRKAGGR